jgi:hypothetical protein
MAVFALVRHKEFVVKWLQCRLIYEDRQSNFSDGLLVPAPGSKKRRGDKNTQGTEEEREGSSLLANCDAR